LCNFSQGGQDSNLQPTVLETVALPIEPPPFVGCVANFQMSLLEDTLLD
jgi:hypothetical protein